MARDILHNLSSKTVSYEVNLKIISLCYMIHSLHVPLFFLSRLIPVPADRANQ